MAEDIGSLNIRARTTKNINNSNSINKPVLRGFLNTNFIPNQLIETSSGDFWRLLLLEILLAFLILCFVYFAMLFLYGGKTIMHRVAYKGQNETLLN